MFTLTRVLLSQEDRLYLNDGTVTITSAESLPPAVQPGYTVLQLPNY